MLGRRPSNQSLPLTSFFKTSTIDAIDDSPASNFLGQSLMHGLLSQWHKLAGIAGGVVREELYLDEFTYMLEDDSRTHRQSSKLLSETICRKKIRTSNHYILCVSHCFDTWVYLYSQQVRLTQQQLAASRNLMFSRTTVVVCVLHYIYTSR